MVSFAPKDQRPTKEARSALRTFTASQVLTWNAQMERTLRLRARFKLKNVDLAVLARFVQTIPLESKHATLVTTAQQAFTFMMLLLPATVGLLENQLNALLGITVALLDFPNP